jgi:peptidyl-prolyl cis-trans isomerase D
MLSLMRKHARSWMMIVILFAIVIVFVFWGVGGFDAPQENHVAVVNGEAISFAAYRQAYDRLREQYRRAYGGALDQQMLKALNLNEQALYQLIDRVVMLQEARRLNIQITEGALDRAILSIPAFQSDQGFDEARAEFILAQNRMTTADFRNIYREDLMLDKLRALILEGVTVSEAEAREWYDWYHAQVNLNFVLFDPSRYTDISPSDEQIADYFQANADDYRTDPQVRVSYILFDPDSYRDQVVITDEEIAQHYYDHPHEFTIEKTVEARHILFKLDEGDGEQVVADQERKAMEVYEKAAAGEPFEELAKQYSEGPTRDDGGYLGFFKRGEMVKPFADRAFAMQAGEISEPVRSRFGWHIIKVETVNEAGRRSLEEAADGIRARLIDEQARRLARGKAEQTYDMTYDGDDLVFAAQTHQVPIHTTDFFTAAGVPLEGVSDAQPFVDIAFSLRTMAISEPLELEGGFYVLQVSDRIEATVPPLEAVQARVKADVTRMLQDEQARTDAEACLAALKQGKDLAEAVGLSDLEPGETGFFKRSGAIPEIGYEPEIVQAAFALQPEQALPEKVFQGRRGWYVLQLKERKLPDEEGFAEEKTVILRQLPEQKKQSIFQQWLADLKARGRIQIEHQMIQ